MPHINYSQLKKQMKPAVMASEHVEAAIQTAVDDISVNGMEVKETELPEPKAVETVSEQPESSSGQEESETTPSGQDVEPPVPKLPEEPAKSTAVDPMLSSAFEFFDSIGDGNDKPSDVDTEIKHVRPGEYREQVIPKHSDQPIDDISSDNVSDANDISDTDDMSYDDEEKPSAKPVQKYRPAKRSSDGSIPVSTVKNIPSDLVNYVRSRFQCTLSNNTIAVSACLYAAVGFPSEIDVSDEIKQAANAFISDQVAIEDIREVMLSRFSKIDMVLREMQRKMNDLETASVYDIFTNLGFRSETNAALTPGEVDFLEIGTGDLKRQLEKQAHAQWEREIQNKGRPIR